jgi:hypothetical protein
MVDVTAVKDQQDSIYLPYRTITFFYGEYEHYCVHHNKRDFGSLSTFRRAFDAVTQDLYKKGGIVLKLSGGHGNINYKVKYSYQ